MAAFDMSNPEAVVSPGGVGFDINCGVRLLRTNLTEKDVAPKKEQLTQVQIKTRQMYIVLTYFYCPPRFAKVKKIETKRLKRILPLKISTYFYFKFWVPQYF